ncbi:MAG: ankyrin repeat domain-containing protein [Phycisphaerales bacterium]
MVRGRTIFLTVIGILVALQMLFVATSLAPHALQIVGFLILSGGGEPMPPLTGLHAATKACDVEQVASMLADGATADLALGPDASFMSGATPLHIAAGVGCREIGEMRLDAGADGEARIDGGWSPLHLATDPGTIDALVRRGANVDARGFGGRAPVMARVTGSSATENALAIDALVANGADLTIRDDAGETAADLARRFGNLQIAGRLEGLGGR